MSAFSEGEGASVPSPFGPDESLNLLSVVQMARWRLEAGDEAGAIELVAGAAERGEADALQELALWHVFGRPFPRSFAVAHELFARAARAGHRGAAITHAVLTALGAGCVEDWSRAVSLLRQAADSDVNAATQIRLLRGMDLKPAGTPRTLPPVETVSPSPKLQIIRGFFTHEECRYMMERARPYLAPSVVVDSRNGQQILNPTRTSDDAVLGPVQMDLVVEALNRRIAAATGTRVQQGEPVAVLRYRAGQEFRLHHDCLPGEHNQRIITFITYLNDDYEGGATSFPALGLELKLRAGDGLFFRDVDGESKPEVRLRHAGRPVVSGEKWISTRWIRQVDFDPWGMRVAAPVSEPSSFRGNGSA